MKKKIFTKIILSAILVLLLYYTAGAAYLTFVMGDAEALSAVALYGALAVIDLILLIYTFASTRLSKAALAETEARYTSYIQNVFSDNHAARRRLLTLLAVADKEKPAKMAAAFLALEKYAKNEWDMATILFFAARATTQMGDKTGAVRLYRRSISERDDFASAWSNLGMIYEMDEDYGAAEECFKRALALEENEPLCYHNLANLYLLTDRAKEASATAKEAIARKADFREAYLVLALAAAMEKNRHEVNQYVRKCVEMGGNEAELARLTDALLEGDKSVLRPAEKTAVPAKKKK
jgi:Flp pilus assembly protein TadD